LKLHLRKARRDPAPGLEEIADGESLRMRLRTIASLTYVFVISILIRVFLDNLLLMTGENIAVDFKPFPKDRYGYDCVYVVIDRICKTFTIPCYQTVTAVPTI
jgi:hypothetical protein